MIKLGVLLSGSGSNLQAIIDAIVEGRLNASIELVVSSRPDAFGLERAQKAGIPTVALTREAYIDPLAADALICEELQKVNVDYLVMAGYMRMVRSPLLQAFPNRIINIHPALLPAFPGAHGIADAFAAGVKVTGVTIHFASEIYDTGPIIAQRALEIREDDTLVNMEQRFNSVVHQLYPAVLQLIAQGRVSIREDGVVRIEEEAT